MTTAHKMEFGPELQDSGEVCFRLWSPAAERVELCLEKPGGPLFLPMEKDEAGWRRLSTGRAGVGSLYRYRIDGELLVPDPASRFQPEGVHGPSQVVDCAAWPWRNADWHGRPWSEAVIYELHVGAFSPAGTFAGVIDKLDYLADLGVTAVELMPVSAFPGRRNWGYDGVLPFAPDRSYGTPAELKRLVDEAHRRNLMIFLDVVYNHFGPEGNYLHHYAPQFFTDRFKTPWGSAINFSVSDHRAPHLAAIGSAHVPRYASPSRLPQPAPPCNRLQDGGGVNLGASFRDRLHFSDGGGSPVRRFFIENVLYWLAEFRFDGLRFDAVHSIYDPSEPDILEEIAAEVRACFPAERQIHLILENDRNEAHYLKRGKGGRTLLYEAQWNDDFHHACHVLLTGETGGYYADYRDNPLYHLGRCLAEGFAYQGEISGYRNRRKRGEPSADLPAAAFVDFLQNHDQVGNRAFGERLAELASFEALRAATIILLLSPQPPLVFMGQEWGARQPFPFFCDFEEELAAKVYEGRMREFAAFPEFRQGGGETIPDPNRDEVFAAAKLDWEGRDPLNRQWLALHQRLLKVRRREIVPHLSGIAGGSGEFELVGSQGLLVRWRHESGGHLGMLANLGPRKASGFEQLPGRLVFRSSDDDGTPDRQGDMPPWAVAFYNTPAPGRETNRPDSTHLPSGKEG
ncbi:MAG: malto-oligosyltrehalose trehalohydrolase [Desulfurivibrionaceae bacterium]